MKRSTICLIFCLLLLASLTLSVSASSYLPMVIDSADLLTGEERIELEEKALSLRTEYEMDVVILTVESLNGKTAQNYADDYYDDNGYGYGENYSGLLFLLAMEEREWYISTCGDAIFAFTDYGLDQLGEAVVPYLSSGLYYEAFITYLAALPDYMEAYAQGSPIDGYAQDYAPGRPGTVYYESEKHVNFGVSLIIGIVAAAIVIIIMFFSMNTKRRQHSAGDYMKQDSYHLRVQRDLFLYSNVSKVRRQENNGSGHGGGSSTHRSSGGRSHGGRGGRF